MIIINDLVAGYGLVKVLQNLSWKIETGKIHGLAGLNGSGKTTLLKTMFGLIKPMSGSLHFNDSSFSKKFISYLETESYFYNGINGREYLSLFKSSDHFVFNTNEWASLFQLPLDVLIDSYSTGMKKKLAILGIIKMNKSFMLLDEPFNGLDLESSRVLSAVLKRLKEEGKTIIITSHMLESLTSLCDQIHYLKNGVIDKSYNPNDIAVMNSEIFRELDQHIHSKINELLN